MIFGPGPTSSCASLCLRLFNAYPSLGNNLAGWTTCRMRVPARDQKVICLIVPRVPHLTVITALSAAIHCHLGRHLQTNNIQRCLWIFFPIFQDDDIVKTLRNYGECLKVHSCRPRGNREVATREILFRHKVKYWNTLCRAVVQHLLWRYSKHPWKWPQATWSSWTFFEQEVRSDEVISKGLWPKWCYYSVIACSNITQPLFRYYSESCELHGQQNRWLN